MLRPLLAAGAAALTLTATGCGLRHTPAAGAAPAAVDLSTTDSLLVSSVGTGAGAAASTSGCGHVRAYGGLVALTSADTGTSVESILGRLRSGASLDSVAGAADATVKQQANAAVKVVADLGVANGRITSAQERQLLDRASAAIDTAMGADVSGCLTGAAVSPSPVPAGL